MTKNMGTIDRVIRLVIVLVVALLYFTGQIGGVLAAILGVLSLIFLVTSALGSCPLYSLFGLSTCSVSEKS